MEKENKLEKSSRNKNDSNSFLFIGAIAESIFPGMGIASSLFGGVSTTYILKPLVEMENDFQTSQKEMPLYAIKNTARVLMDATTISMLRYLF